MFSKGLKWMEIGKQETFSTSHKFFKRYEFHMSISTISHDYSILHFFFNRFIPLQKRVIIKFIHIKPNTINLYTSFVWLARLWYVRHSKFLSKPCFWLFVEPLLSILYSISQSQRFVVEGKGRRPHTQKHARKKQK